MLFMDGPLGTIQILHQHVFGFLGSPTYVSINSTVNQQNGHFLTPPTHLFADVILEWFQRQKQKRSIHCAVVTKLVIQASGPFG